MNLIVVLSMEMKNENANLDFSHRPKQKALMKS